MSSDGSSMTTAKVPMLLPHEIFYVLWQAGANAFSNVFAVDGLEFFWRHFGAVDHPLYSAAHASVTIPIRIYGDDAAHSNVDSFECLTPTSAAHHKAPHWLSRLLCFMLGLKNAVTRTHQLLYKHVVWSLELCAGADGACGAMPERNLDGDRWADLEGADNRWRASVAGEAIAGPFRFLFHELVGDLKWLKESCLLPFNYSAKECCPVCPALSVDASALSPELSCLNLDSEADLYSAPMARTQAQLLEWFASRGLVVPAFLGAVGFDIQRSMLGDWQHCHALGLLHRSNGNLLVVLCAMGVFGAFSSDFETVLGLQLRRAYHLFRQFVRQHKLSCSQQCFTPATVSMTDGTRAFPFLKGKAHNMVTVSHFLAHICASRGITGALRQLSCTLADINKMFSSADALLTVDERCYLMRWSQVALDAWTELSRTATFAVEAKWQMTVKHHFWPHICLTAARTGRNPGSFWVYGDESMIRDLKDSASKGHPSLMSLRTLEARYGLLGLGLGDRHQLTPLGDLRA